MHHWGTSWEALAPTFWYSSCCFGLSLSRASHHNLCRRWQSFSWSRSQCFFRRMLNGRRICYYWSIYLCSTAAMSSFQRSRCSPASHYWTWRSWSPFWAWSLHSQGRSCSLHANAPISPIWLSLMPSCSFGYFQTRANLLNQWFESLNAWLG